MIGTVFTLRALASEWSERFAHKAVTDAWSQHPGELIVAIEKQGQLHLRLQGAVRCTFRSPRSARARRNAVTVLAKVRGSVVRQVRIAEGDRILIIELDQGRSLRAYLFGSRSNVYLTQADRRIVAAFRKGTLKEDDFAPPHVAARLPTGLEEFQRRLARNRRRPLAQALSAACRVFDRTLVTEVMDRANVTDQPVSRCESGAAHALFEAAQQVRQELESPAPRIYHQSHTFSLIALRSLEHVDAETFSTTDHAARAWAQRALARQALAQERDPIRKIAARAARKASRSACALRQQLGKGSTADRYEQLGHLLMAIPPQPAGCHAITVPDLLGRQELRTIPLRPNLSTIDNAERYYRKARNARQAHAMLEERAQAADARAGRLTALVEALDTVSSVAQVRALKVREADTLKDLVAPRKDAPRLPYRSVNLAPGYEVRIGKSARDSDQLTRRHARPFDLWMHARGATGAHLVLRLPHRTAAPSAAIVQQAAAMAAWHSKARGSTLVPVTVTPRKYVRKPKGAAPGAVIVDREEEVIIVRPAMPRT